MPEKLDLQDLDQEDIEVLQEVSKKGYYHGRPKSEAAPAPQRIAAGDADDTSVKRTEFDEFQRKWDRFGERDPAVTVSTSPTQVRDSRPSQKTPPKADESVVAQLVAMGFSEEESRKTAIAKNNKIEAALDYLISGGDVAGTQSSGPVAADPLLVSQLTEMGVPEETARRALIDCNNNFDRAIEQATSIPPTPAILPPLRRARDMLAQLEVDVLVAEQEGLEKLDPVARNKKLRCLEESVTQASCCLDSLQVEGDTALRSERRIELDRCNALDVRIGVLRTMEKSVGMETDAAPTEDAVADLSDPTGTQGGEMNPPVDLHVAGPASGDAISESQNRMNQAEQLRLEGNEAFKFEDYQTAATLYRSALAQDKEDVAILANLAAAEIKLGEFQEAVVHAGTANELSGGFSAKALFRKGQAHEGLKDWASACEAYLAAHHIEPGDKLVATRLQECQQLASAPADSLPKPSEEGTG